MILGNYQSPPEREPIAEIDLCTLHENVKKALSAIQTHFSSTISVRGIDATDLFSMNTLLGSAIEVQTVEALRSMRDVWDPQGEWVGYDFFRYPQSFPDVRLERCSGEGDPVLGIELKSWYLLSKEAEPSFRFKTTAAVCAPCDLVAIVPWSLSDVVSGAPVVHSPFIEQAKYVAQMRNYYWLNTRVGGMPTEKDFIVIPEGANVHPYPPANSMITDKPVSDNGGNFGRIGRVHELMGEWTSRQLSTLLAGIPAIDWIRFLKSHTETVTVMAASPLGSWLEDIHLNDLRNAVGTFNRLLGELDAVN